MNNNMKELIDKINNLNNKELKNIKKDIDSFIQNEVKDINTIERLFDRMLSLVFIDDTILKPIYFTLLEYYAGINKQYSNEYKNYYIEVYEYDTLIDEVLIDAKTKKICIFYRKSYFSNSCFHRNLFIRS